MSKFDLSQGPDFARVTMQNAAAALLQFYPGQNPALWNIQEASYNGVLFHVFTSKTSYSAGLASAHDSGGRRKVKYAFPYVDGQTTDDLGRKGNTYNMDLIIHGPRYLNGLALLLAQFNLPTPGILVHPVMGRIQVAIEDYELTHQNDSRNAVAMKVTFAEHNYSIGTLTINNKQNVKSALATALGAFQTISTAITNVEGAVKFAQGVKKTITGLFGVYSATYAIVLTNINLSFNKSGSQDIPTLLPVNQGGLLNPDGTLSSNNYPVGGTLSSVPPTIFSTTSSAVAANNISKQVNLAYSQAGTAISAIEAQGVNALQLHDTVVSIRQTLVLLQAAFDAGIASSQVIVTQYITPRLMSIREVAFANDLSPNDYGNIVILNQGLLSVNYIPQGTQIQIPTN